MTFLTQDDEAKSDTLGDVYRGSEDDGYCSQPEKPTEHAEVPLSPRLPITPRDENLFEELDTANGVGLVGVGTPENRGKGAAKSILSDDPPFSAPPIYQSPFDLVRFFHQPDFEFDSYAPGFLQTPEHPQKSPSHVHDHLLSRGPVQPVSTGFVNKMRLHEILLRYFVEEAARRFDLCAQKRHFAAVIPQQAAISPPLLNAIDTFSAPLLYRLQ